MAKFQTKPTPERVSAVAQASSLPGSGGTGCQPVGSGRPPMRRGFTPPFVICPFVICNLFGIWKLEFVIFHLFSRPFTP